MARFFTSDTHFGHQNILKFEPDARPFDNTFHMDEVMIERWNEVVKPGDDVWHLGDAIMGDFEAGINKLSRLNGRIFLVPGNHDKVFSKEKDSRRERFLPEYERVFRVMDEQVFTRLLSGDRVLMCHFPYSGDHGEVDRYQDLRPVDEGLPLIHGHVHSLWAERDRQFNVGVDVRDLTPVAEEEIIDWVKTL